MARRQVKVLLPSGEVYACEWSNDREAIDVYDPKREAWVCDAPTLARVFEHLARQHVRQVTR
jgi:hypothetical protein